ncbi:MAG TPA: hypothetical protein GXX20_08500 [Clostridiaceae bacterium]|nr:hypothetical protein [Clostridiaceae bacterium]
MAPSRDWYIAYNVIFNWFTAQYGVEGFDEYILEITKRCYPELIQKIKETGLEGIRDYYVDVFNTDGTTYSMKEDEESLTFEIEDCIDYQIMSESDMSCARPCLHYCRHHEIMNTYFAQLCNCEFSMAYCNGKGQCRWIFKRGSEA